MLVAFMAALAIAALAFLSGALTLSGAAAATLVGALAILAGWRWAALLIVYFVVAVAFSKLGAEVKGRRTGSMVAKAGKRDAMQVLVNGGVFALAACLSTYLGELAPLFTAAALGALAAAESDTLATEIGTLVGGEPRSIVSGHVLPTGASGGVTLAGSLAMIGGALVIALAARAMGLGARIAVVALAGVAGALADSLLGALAQERRRCPQCDCATERKVHDCGAATDPAGGIAWLDNDVVNLCATVVGAVVAGALALA